MSLLLSCQNISKSYASQTLFQDISLGIFRGDRIGVIGPNGSGKSTFLKILSEIEDPDSGSVSYKRSVHVGYVPQTSAYPDESLESILVAGLKEDKSLDEFERKTKAAITLGKLGFDDPDQKVTTLSGGWKKRLDIAQALVKDPDVLLLDEPTNHLDLEGILWLEEFLLRENITYMVISHDRVFLENVTSRMLELNKSYPKGMFSVDGSYSKFLEKREDFLSGQQQYQRSLASKVRREVEWLKQSPKARATKAQSRIDEAGRLIDELAEVKARNKQSKAQIDFSSTDRQTRKLLVAKNLSKTMGDRQLFSHIDFTLFPGSRLGIAGLNGSGKSTLLRLLTGDLTPDQGTIKRAEGLRIVHFDQQREELPLELSLRDALAPNGDSVNYLGSNIHVNTWCTRFLFTKDRLDLPISQLSGGEKARIQIARLMLEPADILLLDEPTNDLDIPTLEVLEESLRDFPGAIVLITHDRFVLDQVSDTILGLGTSSDECLFADYSQWERHKEKEEAKKQSEPVIEKAKTQKQKGSSKKLSYKEKCEWEKMEDKILETDEKVQLLQSRVEDPEVISDPSKLQKLCSELQKAQEHLEALYARWQELEDKQSKG